MREILTLVEDLAEWQEDDFYDACEGIQYLLDDIDYHDQQEILLLQESLLLDEGGEG